MAKSISIAPFIVLMVILQAVRADDPAPSPFVSGVRGLVTRAPGAIVIDGRLNEFTDAFCTPVHYNHGNLDNRAAEFFYAWDDSAFYLALRCLDKKQANPGNQTAIFNGDAIEFYFDARTGDALRSKDWTSGAIHLHISPFEGSELKPRWVVRQGIATSQTVLKGVEFAATRTKDSYECEFKLPWANFPAFDAKLGAVLGIDAELCSGDGAARTDRTFAYGSPLSVQQPASLGKVQLVRRFDPDYLGAVGPVAFPLWVDTAWNQPERATVQAVVAIPPEFTEVVGLVEIRIHDAGGKVVKTLPTRLDPFGPAGLRFLRARAFWSNDDFAPGAFFVTARIWSRTGKTLADVTPRLVDEAIISGR